MTMRIEAAEGRGCSHCETGVAMSWFNTRGHVVALCMGCLLGWFPGKTADWMEERLNHYMDHIDYKLAVSDAKQRGEVIPPRRAWISQPKRDDKTGRWR